MGVVMAELDIAVAPKIILISGLAPELCVILDSPLYLPDLSFLNYSRMQLQKNSFRSMCWGPTTQ